MNARIPTSMSDYPLHTDFMFEYEENLTASSTTQVSRIITQTDRILNNSDFDTLTTETECKLVQLYDYDG